MSTKLWVVNSTHIIKKTHQCSFWEFYAYNIYREDFLLTFQIL